MCFFYSVPISSKQCKSKKSIFLNVNTSTWHTILILQNDAPIHNSVHISHETSRSSHCDIWSQTRHCRMSPATQVSATSQHCSSINSVIIISPAPGTGLHHNDDLSPLGLGWYSHYRYTIDTETNRYLSIRSSSCTNTSGSIITHLTFIQLSKRL